MDMDIENQTLFILVLSAASLLFYFVFIWRVVKEPVCPNCQSTDRDRLQKSSFFSFIHTMRNLKRYRCLNCHKIYYVKNTKQSQYLYTALVGVTQPVRFCNLHLSIMSICNAHIYCHYLDLFIDIELLKTDCKSFWQMIRITNPNQRTVMFCKPHLSIVSICNAHNNCN